MSTSSRSSRSSRSNTASNNNGSASQSSNSSTEEYEIPRVLMGIRDRRNAVDLAAPPPPPIIALPEPANETDDDVVLIAPEIETIDLCTQVVANIPANLHNEVIDITDSPVQIIQPATGVRTRRSRNSGEVATGPVRNRRGGTRTSPYNRAATSTPIPVQASTSQAPQLDIDDSYQSQANAIKYSCPICLESVKNREPVSTMCGHVFCKVCIRAALQQAKKCPMCKKNLNAKNPFIQIFID